MSVQYTASIPKKETDSFYPFIMYNYVEDMWTQYKKEANLVSGEVV